MESNKRMMGVLTVWHWSTTFRGKMALLWKVPPHHLKEEIVQNALGDVVLNVKKWNQGCLESDRSSLEHLMLSWLRFRLDLGGIPGESPSEIFEDKLHFHTRGGVSFGSNLLLSRESTSKRTWKSLLKKYLIFPNWEPETAPHTWSRKV